MRDQKKERIDTNTNIFAGSISVFHILMVEVQIRI